MTRQDFLIKWGVYALVGSAISTSDTIQLITVLPFAPMALKVLGVFVLTGFVIGAGGSGAQLPNISIAATAARVIRFMFIIVQV